MAKLVVISKGLNGLSHELAGNWATIGRDPVNTFQIIESSVSSRHCEVRLQGEDLVVRDLLSTNGTFVAGKKVTESVLKPGEALRLGEVELRFESSLGGMSVTQMLVAGVPLKSASEGAPPVSQPAPNQEARSPGSEPAKRFHVLFVDDSMAFLETFGELCSVLSSQTWKIHTATTADRALAVLQETPMDLVVLDIGIPMVDGIQLLGIIVRRYPGIKVVVMTGLASETNRAACLSAGAELFVEKPIAADGIQVVFNLLNDLLSWTHREGFSGALRQVGLPEVVQMECIGRRSSILEIRNPELRGEIYIEAGVIIHAAVGPLAGEQAVYRLLSLRGGQFQVKPFQVPPQRTVQSGWENLLMEAARANDEETVLLSKPPASPPAPTTAPAGQTVPAGAPATRAPLPAAPGKHTVVGDDIVVDAPGDEKWDPVESPEKITG